MYCHKVNCHRATQTFYLVRTADWTTHETKRQASGRATFPKLFTAARSVNEVAALQLRDENGQASEIHVRQGEASSTVTLKLSHMHMPEQFHSSWQTGICLRSAQEHKAHVLDRTVFHRIQHRDSIATQMTQMIRSNRRLNMDQDKEDDCTTTRTCQVVERHYT